jgi:predicted phosphodiesterase
MGRTILIGDAHGCVDELDALLARCDVGADDRVILVGDLVAKGPDSQGVVQLARERGLLAVRGNHDAHVLRWRLPGEGGKPLKAGHRAVAESLRAEDWAYLEAQPLVRHDASLNLVVVHGGLVPGVPLDAQPPEMLLNLRSIRPDGSPSKRVDDGTAWAKLWRGPAQVVFGHDALRRLQEEPFATGLDTGCVYGGELTALVLPERRFVRVKAKREYAPIKQD